MRPGMCFTRGAFAALLAATVLPATAQASTAALAGTTLTITGTAAGESIVVSGGAPVTVTSSSGITDADGAGTDCSAAGNTLTCADGAVSFVTVNAGDGDDAVTREAGFGTSMAVDGEGGNDALNFPGQISTSLSGDGGPGDDTLTGGANNALDGGEGNDTLIAGPLSSFDSGTTGGNGNDTFVGNDRRSDWFRVEPGADTYNGGTTPPSVNAPAGDQVFQSDCFFFCGSSDSMSYFGDTGVNVTLDGAANDGGPGEADNVKPDIESVSGSNGDDVLDATSAVEPRFMGGGRGNDTLSGGSQDDSLSGGNGNDVVNGGPGDDTLEDFETIDPDDPAGDQAGNDVYNGGPGDDWFGAASTINSTDPAKPRQSGGGLGTDVYNGGDGEDAIFVSRTSVTKRTPDDADPSDELFTYVPVSVSLDGAANDGYPGSAFTIAGDFENAYTGSGADTIVGNAASNVLDGGSGNDTIDGGAGVDLLNGGNGVDTITSRDLGFDRVDCGLAADAAVQGDAGDQLTSCETSNLTALPLPPDTTKPKAKVTAPKKVKAKALRRSKAISLVVTPTEPVILEASVFSGSRSGAIGQVLLGKARLGLKGGKRTVKIRLSSGTIKQLARKARSKKGVPVTVVLVATDAAGLSAKVTRTVRITR